jgi:Uma2 family endonuclease
MTAALTSLATRKRVEGFTLADLHGLPENGLRYELIDGSIVVSPSATVSHNTIARWIANLIEEANPYPDYLVSTDQSTTIDNHNEPRPDIVVVHARNLETTPFPASDMLLAVEVISPHSALRDTETKRALYARACVPSYWIVRPDVDKPTIALAELVLDEQSHEYRYATHYTTGVFRTECPWPMEIDLPALTARRARALPFAQHGA